MKKDALISDCGQYRHWLSRIWDESKDMVMFIGLNPSTADAEVDDPTIRRCIDFAQRWGYGGLYMVNLFDYRATDPKDLLKASTWMSSYCQRHIDGCASRSALVVFAWGSFKKLRGRDYGMSIRFPNAKCLGKNKDGQPKHPLYLRKDTALIHY